MATKITVCPLRRSSSAFCVRPAAEIPLFCFGERAGFVDHQGVNLL